MITDSKFIEFCCRYTDEYSLDALYGGFAYDAGTTGSIYQISCTPWYEKVLYERLLDKAIEGINHSTDYGGCFFQFVCKGYGYKLWFSRIEKDNAFIKEWDWSVEGKEQALCWLLDVEEGRKSLWE